MNKELTDPAFWEKVEAGNILPQIAELEAIEAPSKLERKRLERLRYQLQEIRTEANKLAALNLKWQTGLEGKDNTKALFEDSPELDALFEDSPKQDPSKNYCSFCGSEVDNIHLIRGTAKPHISTRIETQTIGGELVTIEKVVAVVPKVKACPNCQKLVRKPVVISRV